MPENLPPARLNSKYNWKIINPENMFAYRTEYKSKTLEIWQTVTSESDGRELKLSNFKGSIDGKIMFENVVHFVDAEHHLITSVDSENTGTSVPEQDTSRVPDAPLMRTLKEILPAIVEGAATYDHDTGFGIGIHYLEKEDEARLHRIKREDLTTVLEGKFPQTGRFVQLKRDESKKIILSFNMFTGVKVGESYQNGCISYDIREINKIQLHVWEWLVKRMLPEADSEFD